jgi:hypothetical protein
VLQAALFEVKVLPPVWEVKNKTKSLEKISHRR